MSTEPGQEIAVETQEGIDLLRQLIATIEAVRYQEGDEFKRSMLEGMATIIQLWIVEGMTNWKQRARRAEARIAQLEAEVNRLTYTNPLAGEWAKRAKGAEQRAERLRWQLNEAVSLLREVVRVLPFDGVRAEIEEGLPDMQAALTDAPDPARPATKPPLRKVIQDATKKWDTTTSSIADPEDA